MLVEEGAAEDVGGGMQLLKMLMVDAAWWRMLLKKLVDEGRCC